MWKFLAFLLEIPAWLVMFLPFTWGVSPLAALVDGPFMLALPYFLPLVFTLFRARLCWGAEPGWAWTSLMLLVAVFPVLLLEWALLYELRTTGPDWLPFLLHGATICLALAVMALLWRRKAPPYLGALMLGRVTYLANGVLCLWGFWHGLQIGAYLSMVTCAIYLVEAVGLVRQGWIYQRRKQQREGLCPVCGYDLRASPVRCPECGTVRKGPRAAMLPLGVEAAHG